MVKTFKFSEKEKAEKYAKENKGCIEKRFLYPTFDYPNNNNCVWKVFTK